MFSCLLVLTTAYRSDSARIRVIEGGHRLFVLSVDNSPSTCAMKSYPSPH